MKRTKYLLAVVAILPLLVACHTRRSDVMGDWVTSNDSVPSGFNLGYSGIAASIGNPETQYLSWSMRGERIYLHGKRYRQGCAHDFIDTLVITSFSPTTMTVWVKDKKINYVRP